MPNSTWKYLKDTNGGFATIGPDIADDVKRNVIVIVIFYTLKFNAESNRNTVKFTNICVIDIDKNNL